MDKLSSNLLVMVFLLLLVIVYLLRKIYYSRKRYQIFNQAFEEVKQGHFYFAFSLSKIKPDPIKVKFNEMMHTLDMRMKKMDDLNIKYQSILASISHGIIALDHKNRVIIINRAALNILRRKDIPERILLQDLIKNEELLQLLQGCIDESTSKQIQFTYQSKTYNIIVDSIRMQETPKVVLGSIIILEDVTERYYVEKIRTDFVANVTHELKTPLTSINGFVETLKLNQEIDAKTRMRFYQIIESESGRLRRLIDDILTLSLIENKGLEFQLDQIDIVPVIKDSLLSIESILNEKKTDIKLHFSQPHIFIYASEDLVKQLVINLVENGVKYSEKKPRIEIDVVDESERVLISIEDHGIGIPEEDVPRIFERFYRVDKARSKKVGGTGLGLAIVKHIIINMHGTISVRTKVNQGTKFILDLPKQAPNLADDQLSNFQKETASFLEKPSSTL